MIVELSLDEELKLIQVKERMSFSGRRKSIFGEKRNLQVGRQCAIVGEDYSPWSWIWDRILPCDHGQIA